MLDESNGVVSGPDYNRIAQQSRLKIVNLMVNDAMADDKMALQCKVIEHTEAENLMDVQSCALSSDVLNLTVNNPESLNICVITRI
jgi:hypothetical protein